MIVIDGDRIADVLTEAPAESSAVTIDLSGHTVLPGLMDMHAHMIGEMENGQGYAGLVMRTAAQEAMTGIRNARATVEAGFTTVRDVGTFRAFVDCALRDAIDAGDTPGPRMMCAGAFVTVSGGGGDVTGLAPDVDAAVPIDLRFGVSNTADEVRTRVRRILSGGADFIKVIATGAVLTEGTTPGAPEFSEDEIRAAVEEAALVGTHVAAHAHGAEGIKRAVRAGVRSIEHGSLMDDEAIELMASHGTYLVADIYCGDWIAEEGARGGWSPDVIRKNEETTDAQREGFTKAVKRGRLDRVRDRQRRVPPRDGGQAAGLHGPVRHDADGGDPQRDRGGVRADGLAGPGGRCRARPVRRPGRRRGRPTPGHHAPRIDRIRDEGRRRHPFLTMVRQDC